MATPPKMKPVHVTFFACVVLLGAVLLYQYLPRFLPPWLSEEAARRAGDAAADERRKEQVKRVVEVVDAYLLEWPQRGEAPALRMRIPAAELGGWQRFVNPRIQEQLEGPREIRLAVFVPDTGRLAADRIPGWCATPKDGRCELKLTWMKLSRAGAVPFKPKNSVEAFWNKRQVFWLKREDGAWRFHGFDCAGGMLDSGEPCYEPRPPASWYPRLFGLVPATVDLDLNHGYGCEMKFEFEGRAVHMDMGRPCKDRTSALTLWAGVDLLGRLAREAEQPAPGEERLARARRALENCKAGQRTAAAAQRTRKPGVPGDAASEAEYLCRYVANAGFALLKELPLEASEVTVEALLPARPGRGTPWDRWYLESILQALAAAGAAESRQAILAHALFAERTMQATEPPVVKAREASVDFLPSAAQKLAADDPALDAVDDALGSPSADRVTQRKRAAFAAARHEKAQATAPGSDLAFKTRLRLCDARFRAGVERETLNECAEALLAGWEARADAGKPFGDLGRAEEELPWMLMGFYDSYVYATRDYAGALAGMRRAGRLAAQRLPSSSFNDAAAKYTAQLEKLATEPARGVAR